MVEKHDVGMVRRRIVDDMHERELVEKDPQLGHGGADPAGKIFLVYLLHEGEDGGVTPHQCLQEVGHGLLGNLDVVQRLPVHGDPDARGDVHFLRI